MCILRGSRAGAWWQHFEATLTARTRACARGQGFEAGLTPWQRLPGPVGPGGPDARTTGC